MNVDGAKRRNISPEERARRRDRMRELNLAPGLGLGPALSTIASLPGTPAFYLEEFEANLTQPIGFPYIIVQPLLKPEPVAGTKHRETFLVPFPSVIFVPRFLKPL